jgi:hypothetical protein
MKVLSVVGTEMEYLIVVSEDGERFHIPLNAALTDAVRKQVPPAITARHASPRVIQAHIRRGLTATQVADLTGEEVDYVQKYEGAVVAERAFIASQALAVGVTTRDGSDTTFGNSVRARLRELSATENNWSAWKEESGWQLELTFTDGEVEHKARWTFEPRKHLLEALNEDAKVLSRHDPMPTTLIPALSAVRREPEAEPDRFDSEIFDSSDLGETGPLLEPVPYGRTPQSEGRMADTADLLEVLRKRRGEREPMPESPADENRGEHPATGGIHLVEDQGHDASVTPIGSRGENDGDDDPEPPSGGKKKRPEMPSWDDIVFGARGDDDSA